MARLGVKLSGPEFEACWQYADPRGEGELSEEYFVSGLGEIDPNVDEDDKAANVGEIAKRRASLAGLADNTADGKCPRRASGKETRKQTFLRMFVAHSSAHL